MGFIELYIIIPFILYILSPKKINWILIIYYLFITTLSYDNVTDFGIYYNEFQYYLRGVSSEEMNEKGRELGWMIIMRIFSFTEYGIVIIHSVIIFFTCLFFLRFSYKLKILSTSILLIFLLNIVTLHDNILRQDVAMVFGVLALFEVIKDDKISRLHYFKITVLIGCAFLFHFSAILLIPFAVIVKWMSKIQLKFTVVFFITIICCIIVYSGLIGETIGIYFFLFSMMDVNYTNYYSETILPNEISSGGIHNVLMCLISIMPLYYYKNFNLSKYKENKFLRLSVNLVWIIIVWKELFLPIVVLTRIVDYLVWFEIWGFAYMISDIADSKRQVKLLFLSIFFIVIVYNDYKIINSYYGDNNYLTIFSEECLDMRIYNRDADNFSANRVR